MKFDAVIFDWAGTTVDYGSRAPATSFVEVFRRKGIAVTEAEARGPMGLAKRDHIVAMTQVPRIAQLWQEQHGSAPDDVVIDEMYDDFLPLQKEVLLSHSDIIPGVIEAVEECRRRGMKIGSNTGYVRELMDVVIPLATQGGYTADSVVCSDEVAAGRPAPWMNFRAAEELGVFPMSKVLAVDDTVAGIVAGVNSGCTTIGISKSGNGIGLSKEEVDALDPAELDRRLLEAEAKFKEAGADYVLHSVADLPALLDSM